jgi:hypothetical protein
VTGVAVGCGPMVSPRIGRRHESESPLMSPRGGVNRQF